MEVAAKLAHTLWRKLLPYELSLADDHLYNLTYDALQYREWPWARTLARFHLSQRKLSDDLQRRMVIINLAIALKFGKQPDEARAELARHDWSATLPEFRLAISVLENNFTRAAAQMVGIGKEGESIKRHAYLTWPLFREFRASQEFLEAFERVYGCAFINSIK